MKKISWLFAATVPLVLLFSCQKEVSSVSENSDLRTPNRRVASVYTPTSCETKCITSAGPFFEKASTLSYSASPAGTVTVTVWNTPTQIVYSFSSSVAMKKITIAGTVVYADETGTTSTSFSYALPVGWTGCQTVSRSVDVRRENSDGIGGGQYVNFGTVSYNLIPVCASTCTLVGNSFSGQAISCGTNREAVYTFGAQNGASYFKIQGGLTNFTGENATVYINNVLVDFNTTSADDWATGTVNGFTIGQRTPGGSSNRNIRVEGGLGTCMGVTIKILWSSTNSGGVITGDWSVVDGIGVALAPSVAGLTCQP